MSDAYRPHPWHVASERLHGVFPGSRGHGTGGRPSDQRQENHKHARQPPLRPAAAHVQAMTSTPDNPGRSMGSGEVSSAGVTPCSLP